MRTSTLTSVVCPRLVLCAEGRVFLSAVIGFRTHKYLSMARDSERSDAKHIQGVALHVTVHPT